MKRLPRRGFRNVQAFLEALRSEGELRVVHRHVSPILEVSRLTDEESKSPGGGKALLFKSVEGSAFPLVTNLFGSMKRMTMALGVEHLDELGERVQDLMNLSPPRNLYQAVQMVPLALSLARCFPRRRRIRAPCQEVVHTGEDVDLSRLPVLQCWPKDGGRFITLPLVITKSLETGRRNMGMYRMQVFDRRTTGMHWHVHKDGSHAYQEYMRAGKRMPVAVAVGADPATMYAATAPLPRNVDELMLAGFLRNRSVPLVKAVTVELEVPAEAEFILEGYVDPGECRREGPFGDHTGYYSLADDYPVFHVTAVTHRRSPVYCTTVVGPPPMEDGYLGLATERLFLPLLQAAHPEIQDYWLPWEGVFHNLVIASIHKTYSGHAQKVMHALWGQGQMSFAKGVVIVDRDVPLHDPRSLVAELLGRFDPQSDVTLTQGILDVLDHAAPASGFGAKIGIDLTRRLPEEPPRFVFQAENAAPPMEEVAEALRKNVPGVMEIRSYPSGGDSAWTETTGRVAFLRVERDETKNRTWYAARIQNVLSPERRLFLILFDRDTDLSQASTLAWKLLNNVDPQRDIQWHGQCVIVDACRKTPADGHLREWPEELSFQQ
jgi:4-hydroxy-3-polyprenylbenzoate decarboxylase